MEPIDRLVGWAEKEPGRSAQVTTSILGFPCVMVSNKAVTIVKSNESIDAAISAALAEFATLMAGQEG